MFRCPDDEQRRTPRLSDQDGSGVAEGELDQPIRAWVDLVAYRRNAAAVARLDFVEGQVPLRLTVEAWAAYAEWPTQRMHCAQHQARAAGMIRSGPMLAAVVVTAGKSGLGRSRSGIAVGTVAGPAA